MRQIRIENLLKEVVDRLLQDKLEGKQPLEVHEEAFREVFGPEHSGRVRGLGAGALPSQVFPKQCKHSSMYWQDYHSNSDLTDKFKEMKEKIKDIELREAQRQTEIDQMKKQMQENDQFQNFARVMLKLKLSVKINVIPGPKHVNKEFEELVLLGLLKVPSNGLFPQLELSWNVAIEGWSKWILSLEAQVFCRLERMPFVVWSICLLMYASGLVINRFYRYPSEPALSHAPPEKAIHRTKSMLAIAVEETYKALHPDQMVVVDLGCSSGPNTLLVLSHVLSVATKLPTTMELQFFLNDLLGNDFNSLFLSLKGFKKRSRHTELNVGGRMVLVFVGRRKRTPGNGDFVHLYGLLGEALNSMVLEGIVPEEKVDTFNLSTYGASFEEVESMIHNEGLFDLDQAEIFESSWDPFDDSKDDFYTISKHTRSGKNVANYICAVVEPLIVHQFGTAILDDLFERYAHRVSKHLLKEKANHTILVFALKKKA
ncbi:hypothetical protein ZIOFF_066663 [Zingiber officinale]|uniref:Uncharacterized protein n=1 Tax=Zingiber officinale TaxID=94328 RepID=A0A8J5KE24_ZINOF|nr:hypothetical protein ZIOFF_066663 [Zingiber officinale]